MSEAGIHAIPAGRTGLVISTVAAAGLLGATLSGFTSGFVAAAAIAGVAAAVLTPTPAPAPADAGDRSQDGTR